MAGLDIRFRILPTQLIVSDFISGYDNCNYEFYVRDFINSSWHFLKKSSNGPYLPPLSEEKGQCDCTSKNYQLDFKLLLSETMGQGKREFSTSITHIGNCITLYGESNKTSKDTDYKEIKATYLHTAFRNLSYNELCEIAETEYRQHGFERDVHLILKYLRKPKNIPCMLPYEFYYTDGIQYETGRIEIISALNSDFSNMLRYRESKQPKYEMYMAFIYHQRFIILQSTENKLIFVDEVELTKSKTYQELAHFSEY